MAEVLENATRLSEVIGARPGGTEEEQQASFFIEEAMQGLGLETSIEEFNCNPNYEIPRFVCCVISLVLAVLAIFLPLMVIPALIVCALTAILYVLEVVGLSPLSNMAKRGISQNVVAKYIPGATGDTAMQNAIADTPGRASSRRVSKRKIILIARYDSGRVCRELKNPFFKMLPVIQWVEIGGMILIPFALLFKQIFAWNELAVIITNVLIAVGAICALIPIIVFIMHQTAPYSKGANNNAAGVTVMAKVASNIVANQGTAKDLMSTIANIAGEDAGESATDGDGAGELGANNMNGVDTVADENAAISGLAASTGDAVAANASGNLAVMHGEDALRNENVLPLDTDLVYEEAARGRIDISSVEREKAAAERIVAAGEVVASTVSESMDGRSTNGQISSKSHWQSPVQEQNSVANVRFDKKQDNVPDWFKKGIAKANARRGETTTDPHARAANDPSIRSRLSDALDAAEAELNEPVNSSQVSTISGSGSGVSGFGAGSITGSSASAKAASENGGSANRHSGIDAIFGDVAPTNMGSALGIGDGVLESGDNAAAPTSSTAAKSDHASKLSSALGRATSLLSASATAPQPAVDPQMTIADVVEVAEAAEVVGVEDAAGVDAPDAAAGVGAGAADASAVVACENAGIIDVVDDSQASLADVAQKQAIDHEIEAARDQQIVETAGALSAEGEAAALAAEAEEEAAVADRTISYIPVAADISTDISTHDEEISLANTNIGKSASEILEEATVKAGEESSEVTSVRDRAASRRKREISLPSLTGALDKVVSTQQSAPLAEDADREAGESRTALKRTQREQQKRLENTLNAVDQNGQSGSFDTVIVPPSPSASGAIAATKALTTLEEDAMQGLDLKEADVVESVDIATNEKNGILQVIDETTASTIASIPATPAATDNFKAVRGTLIEDMAVENLSSDDIIIDDVDDSDYEENLTLTGAMAGPGYVEMPKSRRSRLKNLFGRKKKTEEVSFSEAIGVGADFDARKVGTSRGGWESFQNESADFDAKHASTNASSSSRQAKRSTARRGEGRHSRDIQRMREEENSAWKSNNEWDDWEGGAARLGSIGDKIKRSTRSSKGEGSKTRRPLKETQAEQFDYESDNTAAASEDAKGRSARSRRIEGQVDEREEIRRFRRESPFASLEGVLPLDEISETEIAEEEDDANKPFMTEVWFVALGAELTDNAGIKAFLAAHDDELRGAVIVELEALGAGDLCQISEEGRIKHKKPTSRMHRFVNKAANMLGMRVGSSKMTWRDSATFFAAEKGLQTIHVAGIVDGKPAYMGEADDVIENISEEKLLENAAFVTELVRTI